MTAHGKIEREIITWVLQREANRAQLAGCPPPVDIKQ